MLTLTLPELERVQSDAVDALVDMAGNDAHLALMLGINIMTVRGWTFRRRVSKKGALTVEQHPILGKHFTALDLRPDITT